MLDEVLLPPPNPFLGVGRKSSSESLVIGLEM